MNLKLTRTATVIVSLLVGTFLIKTSYAQPKGLEFSSETTPVPFSISEEEAQKNKIAVDDDVNSIDQDINKAIEYLNYIKSKVQNQKANTYSQNSLKEIDLLTAEFEKYQQQVALDLTYEELGAVRKELLNVWQISRILRLKFLGIMLVGDFSDYIDEMDGIINELQDRLRNYPDSQINFDSDITDLEDIQSQLNGYKKTLSESAKAFNSISTQSQVNALAQNGIGLVNQVKQDLYQVNADLKNSILVIKDKTR